MAEFKAELEEIAKNMLLEAVNLADLHPWYSATFEEMAEFRREVPYYNFWFWEYQRRNPLYIEECEKYKKNIKIEEKEKERQLPLIDSKYRQDHQWCDPQEGECSSAILKKMCNGCFKRLEPIPFFWIAGLFDNNSKAINYKWEGIREEKPRLSISFDLEIDQKMILEYMKELHEWAGQEMPKIKKICKKKYFYEYYSVADFFYFIEDISKQGDAPMGAILNFVIENYREWWDDYLTCFATKTIVDPKFQIPPSNGKRKASNSETDEARATGIWLWDYTKEKRCDKAESIRVLKKKFDLSKIGMKNTSERKFYHYLKIADQCIHECEVLSM